MNWEIKNISQDEMKKKIKDQYYIVHFPQPKNWSVHLSETTSMSLCLTHKYDHYDSQQKYLHDEVCHIMLSIRTKCFIDHCTILASCICE